MAKRVKVRSYTRSAPKRKSKGIKPSKAGERYGKLPHQRMPRKGEL